MRQLTLTAPKTLEWLDVAPPQLASDKAAIVRPIAVGVCDFDRALVQGRYTALPYPIALGHEIVAEVVEIGAGVRNVTVGMQVVLPLHISCGSCAKCKRRLTNSCLSRKPLSNYGLGARAGDWGGGMSDLLGVPFADAMAAPRPAGLTAVECAAVGCNLVDLYRTIAPHVDTASETRVLIVGGHAHNMALYGIVVARALGVQDIDFLDDDAARRTDATALGARALFETAHLYPIVIDCSGDPDRLALALSKTEADGVCTPVWPYVGSHPLPIGAMFMRNVTLITGQPHARALMTPVLQLMQEHAIHSASIPVDVLPWESASEEFGFGDRKRIFVRP
jgi:threonine dehydrogenase-like Zn-dependent dehydrogenase